MQFLISSARAIVLAMFLVSAASTAVLSDAPGCPECENIDPTDDVAYEACVVLNGCSDQVDVPVSGNVWVLALAGFVFAFVKFGGHTKLAGYYYSKLEKQS